MKQKARRWTSYQKCDDDTIEYKLGTEKKGQALNQQESRIVERWAKRWAETIARMMAGGYHKQAKSPYDEQPSKPIKPRTIIK